MQKINTSICAVVPVYNSEKTLHELVERLTGVLNNFKKYSIILVDDCSADNSFEIIKDLYGRYPHITGIKLTKNYGQQRSVFCGLSFSHCNYTVIIDDDMEHNPDDIMVLYREIIKGYDAVYGINENNNEKGLLRNLGSKIRDLLFNIITNKPKHLKVCSFKIINRKTADNILKADTGFVYISLEILKHTNNIQNVKLKYNPCAQSNYRLSRLIGLLVKMYIYYAPGAIFKKLQITGKCCHIEVILRKG